MERHDRSIKLQVKRKNNGAEDRAEELPRTINIEDMHPSQTQISSRVERTAIENPTCSETTSGTEDRAEETINIENHTISSRVERTTMENPTSGATTSGTICLSCATLQSKVDNLSHQVSELRKSLIISEVHASEQRIKHLQLETLLNQATASIGMLQKECIESKTACHSLAVVNAEIQVEKQSLVDELEVTKKENRKLQYNKKELMDENRELASFFFTEENMKTSKKEKILFYTGLPNFETLKLVVDTVGTSSLKQRGRPTFLGDFQEIVLTLMKLRLDLSEEDIAYRFQISQSTVSRIFGKWINIMAESLKFLIRWPSRDRRMGL